MRSLRRSCSDKALLLVPSVPRAQSAAINPSVSILHTLANTTPSLVAKPGCRSSESLLSPTASSVAKEWKERQSFRIGLSFEQRRFCLWLKNNASPKTVSFQDAENCFNNSSSCRSLDISMESEMVFNTCWARFEDRYGLEAIRVPREVVWLNGAPGSGKGANTSHILKMRGLGNVMSLSSLLISNPETRALIDRGDMIPDTMAGDVMLKSLLLSSAQNGCGVLVDGFPRTSLQVDFLKLLHEKLRHLHTTMAGTPVASQFPRPMFKVVVLYVDEETSIQRQMKRAQEVALHNQRVLDAGAGDLMELRQTDLSVERCKKRYEIFKAHYGSILRLKHFFGFHLIDAMGLLAETKDAIAKELRYQSSLDLSESTYAAISHLPLSFELPRHARQQLVARLDNHYLGSQDVYQQVVNIINMQVMPQLQQQGLAGFAEFVTDLPLFKESPRAVDILLDVLTDRGFSISHSTDIMYIPTQFDFKTGSIMNHKQEKHKFTITWDTKGARSECGLGSMPNASDSPTRGIHISQSYFPTAQKDALQTNQTRAAVVSPQVATVSSIPSIDYKVPNLSSVNVKHPFDIPTRPVSLAGNSWWSTHL